MQRRIARTDPLPAASRRFRRTLGAPSINLQAHLVLFVTWAPCMEISKSNNGQLRSLRMAPLLGASNTIWARSGPAQNANRS